MSRKWLLTIPVLALLAACTLDPKQATQNLVDTGNKYFKNGKYREASIIYRRALQKDRRHGEAWFHLGQSQFRMGRYQAAIRSLTRAVELAPENEEAYAQLADIHLSLYLADRKRFESALTEVQRLNERAENYFPESFHVSRIKGFVALSNEDYPAAISHFETCLKRQPDNDRVSLGLVRALAGSGRSAEAEKAAREFIERHAEFGPMYDTLYVILLRERRFDEARALLELKCKRNPVTLPYRLQLAYHDMSRKNQAGMEATLAYVLDRPQEFPNAYQTVASFYARLRDFERAAQVLEQGIKAQPQQAPALKNRLIEILAIQGKAQEAFRLAEAQLAANPRDIEARALRGALRLRSGEAREIDAAVADLEAVLEKLRDNPVLRFNLGEAYLAKGNLDRAMREYEQITRTTPGFLRPRYRLVEAYLSRGESGRAVEQANQILQLRPDDPAAMLLRARARLQMGEREQARADLRALLERQPDNRDGIHQLALLSRMEERYDEAERAFRTLYEATPPDLRGLIGLADTYMAQGRLQDAVRLLETEAAKAPDDLRLRMALGGALLRTRELSRAQAEYQYVRDKNPNNGLAHRFLGEVQHRLGNTGEAEQSLQRAAELLPNDPEPPLLIGMIAEQQGAVQRAVVQYQKVLEVAPNHAIALNNLAYLLAETTADLDRALSLVQKARSQEPDDPNIADTLAWIYIKRNLNDSAIQILDEVLAKHPKVVIWRYHLGLALYQKGDRARARQELETALQSNPSAEERQRIRDLLSKAGA